MAENNEQDSPRFLNSLRPDQQQVALLIGHSLVDLYSDVLNAPLPPHLLALVGQLARVGPRDRHPPREENGVRPCSNGRDRYYFDVQCDDEMSCTDAEGIDLRAHEDVRHKALQVAGELTKERIHTHKRITVRVRDAGPEPVLVVEVSVAEFSRL
ncbi:hypothetical protein [Microvirga sp. VF16]|uniref:DUF6894 family protein n=1 Tax=Microvirga sp. VF16 TaxID=2807101 RepID=UPI00193D6E8C|nr:hypothetical protein [Microvirga sp. VF16]QRM32472.1 hypothetical protein JO965_30725 [Microvirga sp. VF16]